MKDAKEKPRQVLGLKYSFKSIESNLKICHGVPSRSQASSNYWAKNRSRNSEDTVKITNSYITRGSISFELTNIY